LKEAEENEIIKTLTRCGETSLLKQIQLFESDLVKDFTSNYIENNKLYECKFIDVKMGDIIFTGIHSMLVTSVVKSSKNNLKVVVIESGGPNGNMDKIREHALQTNPINRYEIYRPNTSEKVKLEAIKFARSQINKNYIEMKPRKDNTFIEGMKFYIQGLNYVNLMGQNLDFRDD
jgi:hypothetical protein